MTSFPILSGYRLMWLFVMFDLPVVTKSERKSATRFRKHLLDLGFEMTQYSVYMRLLSGKERVQTVMRQVEAELPESGVVKMLTITDKQFETMVTYHGSARQARRKNPDQLALF